MAQGIEIFDVQGMAEAIRYTEYKSIYSAISEIVDNSIEAKAKNILIISKETLKDGEKTLGDIAILDDGTGMSLDTLHRCLVFGISEKKERKSIGRFGVGLGQASMYAAPRVDVYSWQDRSDKYAVYLDSREMKNGTQKVIEAPEKKEIPTCFKGFLDITIPNIGYFNFHQSGTMVVWENLDNVKLKTQTFYKNLSDELGRRFRYYIDGGLNIIIITTQHSPRELVKSIDPLFLSKKSRYLADLKTIGTITNQTTESEPIFEPFISDYTPDGTCKIDIHIEASNHRPIFSTVSIKCSVVKEKFYWDMARLIGKKNPGDSEIGKTVSKFDNISVVRAGREIQFDKLGLYNSTNEPENRWWSIEISFDPILDEFFKLSNNKQKVEIETSFRTDRKEKFVQDDSLEAQAWRLIIDRFDKIKLIMTSRNRKLAQNAKKELGSKPTKKIESKYKYETTYKGLDAFAELAKKYQTDEAHKGSVYDEIRRIIDVELVEDKKLPLITIDSINTGHKLIINELDGFYTRIRDNEDFALGFNLFAHALTKVRSKFNLYEEEKVFSRLIEEINEEITTIKNSLGGTKL